ncbi:PREDICTED: uncharacterized protein LOC104819408 isoform X2 [Tarenaya hassleriana]|uniref:uncharacterized protein LOC104819408 isoform X1 n=1 Tax=Tarenaya hassleriana TaxID=28532 RepID=UPI00053C9E2D|nr:PREDICTED: uncharacterized protein LOC104819408 isoform X1 [Tarenaya hassleriana]XP_019058728.1 PREDICTED: uncharacterized protein LOC104819408 isoform X2 [Tarenaya hassleriana]
MAEENDFDAKDTMASGEGCSKMIRPRQTPEGQGVIPEIHELTELDPVNLRRHSTGVIGTTKPGKAKVQSRYLRDHVSSTHDICKHGKRREDEDGEEVAVKPWKSARRKSVGGEDTGKIDASCVRRKSLGGVCPQNSGFRPKNPETCSPVVVGKSSISSKSDASTDAVRSSGDGRTGKNKETENTPGDSAVVRKVAEKKTKITAEKVSKDDKAVSSLKKNVKKGHKEDVPEKTLYVVESSVEKRCGIEGDDQGKIHQASGKKISRATTTEKNTGKVPKEVSPSSGEDEGSKKPRKSKYRVRRMASRAMTSLHKRKGSVPADEKPENMKDKAKKMGIKRGKAVLEPKPDEDSKPRRRKGQRERQEGNPAGSGKAEKVVLRHRSVEGKKKLETLFNNVIEETASKLVEVRKSKVKALVGAFESVISLQHDNSKPSHKLLKNKA